MGIPLCVICCFSLAAFNMFSLYLIFDSLINVCLVLRACFQFPCECVSYVFVFHMCLCKGQSEFPKRPQTDTCDVITIKVSIHRPRFGGTHYYY